MDMLDKCRSEGYVAGEHGAGLDFNPERPGTPEWESWVQGWNEADHDYRYEDCPYGGRSTDSGLTWLLLVVILFVLGAGIKGLYELAVYLIG